MTLDPTSTPASRRRLLTNAAGLAGGLLVGAAGGLTADLIRPATAEAAPAPRVYTRAEWGARRPTGTIVYLDRQPDHIVIHHTASANVTDYSLNAAFALSRWIQDLHISNGWSDSGQQLTISRGGYVMEGRYLSLRAIYERQHVRGAQTANHNDHTIGIENEGTYISETPPAALLNSLVATCAWLCTVYDLDPYEAIVGHRDYVATQCPGDAFYALLPELRNRVARAL